MQSYYHYTHTATHNDLPS